MVDRDPPAWRYVGVTLGIARFAERLARHPERLRARCFTPEERAYAAGRRLEAQHLAVRFAAKQAARALLGAGGWREIEVRRDGQGAPALALTGAAARAAAGRPWRISLSHDADAAVAWVALGPAP